MKQYLGRMGVVAVFAVAALCLAVTPVYAHERGETEQKTAELNQKQSDQLKQKVVETRQKVSEIRAEAKQRLGEAKRKLCADRQSAINTSMNRVIDRRQKQIDHISEISTRVQVFYTKQAHTLASYDALVADVAAKKAIAQAALDATKSSATFNCDSDGPKAELRAFREKRSVVVAAIKDYRQSVKKLIAGVKSVQPDKERQ